MASKPDNLPIWDETEERVTQPDVTRQQTGFVWSGTKFEKPKGEHFNWLFNNVYKWVKYFDEVLNINALTEKTTLNSNDEFLIEDSEDSNAKKKAKLSSISSLVSRDVETAWVKYFDEVLNINALTEKTTLNSNDEFLIEDSEDSNAKKKAKLSSIASLVSRDVATAEEIRTGTDNTKAVTSLGINETIFGMGQTWQNVTASRSARVTYTNTTGKPIMVIVGLEGYTGASQDITVNGVIISRISYSSSDDEYKRQVFIVPPNSTYSVSVSWGAWYELR